MKQKNQIHVTTYTDGGARGNPGPAAIGCVLTNHTTGKTTLLKEYLGRMTNNQAEYSALIRALEMARDQEATHVQCFLDSELIVKQMKRIYKIKNEGLASLFLSAWNLAATFQSISFTHIPRVRNRAADRLVNEALDEVRKKSLDVYSKL